MFNKLRIAITVCCKRLLSPLKFRGKGTLLLLLCPKRGTVELDLFGYVFTCDLSEHIQRSIFLFNYDEHAEAFIRKNVKSGDVFVDVGANVGFYTLLAASIVGQNGKVIAIEPNPKTFAKLKNTIEQNGIANILPLNIGLGKEAGTQVLYFDSRSGNDMASMVAHHYPESVSVSVATLDNVVESAEIDRIKYLKIDVDGFEPNVFAGAAKLLEQGRIDCIQSEFCDFFLRQNGSSPDELHRTLTNAGLRDVQGAAEFTPGCIIDRFFTKRSVVLQN